MSWSPEFQRVDRADGAIEVRLGHPVVDRYLEFLAARCRPNTVLAAGFDLKVFFTLVPVSRTILRCRPVTSCDSGSRQTQSDRSSPRSCTTTVNPEFPQLRGVRLPTPTRSACNSALFN